MCISFYTFSIGSGKIVNHTVMTEYHEHSRILQANFRNMTLRDKGRGDRRGTESVAEEKFSIVFQADIIVRTGLKLYTKLLYDFLISRLCTFLKSQIIFDFSETLETLK